MDIGEDEKAVKPLISVCIPTYNRQEDLLHALEALANQSLKKFEVIIIEGGDAEKTNQILEEHASVLSLRLFSQKESGLVNARNQAWKESNADICVFIDDDVIPNSYWLEEIEKTYDKFGEFLGGVGGPSIIPANLLRERDLTRYLLKPNSLLERIIRNVYFTFFLENEPYQVNKVFRSGAFSVGSMIPEVVRKKSYQMVEVDYLDASNMSFKRSLLDELGGFDSVFKGIGDFSEPDLCFRIRNRGYKLLFNPYVSVHHNVSKSGAYSKRKSASEALTRFLNMSLFLNRYIGINRRSCAYQSFVELYLAYSLLRS